MSKFLSIEDAKNYKNRLTFDSYTKEKKMDVFQNSLYNK